MSERLFHEQLIVAWRALEEIAEMPLGRVWGLDSRAEAFAHCVEIADRALIAMGELEKDEEDDDL